MAHLVELNNLMKLSIRITILLAITFALVFAPSTMVLSQVIQETTKQDLNVQNEAFLGEAGLSADISLSEIVSVIIKVFLSFLGVIFVVLIVYAGFIWMTSAGNQEKIGTAKNIMVAAIIGLIIVLAAYMITYFVLDKIIEATKGTQGLD